MSDRRRALPDRPPHLRTARLTLEPLVPEHAREMFDRLGDPAIYHYIPDRPPANCEDLVAEYRRMAVGHSPDGADLWCNWIVRRNRDAICIGIIQATIQTMAVGSGCALIGYIILPEFWRQGVARESVTAMLDCLFGDYGCAVADALVDTENLGSLALLAGLGFGIVDRIDEADFFAGRRSDEYHLQLDAESWRGRARA